MSTIDPPPPMKPAATVLRLPPMVWVAAASQVAPTISRGIGGGQHNFRRAVSGQPVGKIHAVVPGEHRSVCGVDAVVETGDPWPAPESTNENCKRCLALTGHSPR